MKKDQPVKEKVEKKVKWPTILTAAVFLIIGYFILTGILFYGFNCKFWWLQKTVSTIPYPAAVLDKKVITIREVEKRLEAVKKFYESQDFSEMGLRVDFTTPDGKKRLKIKEKNILTKVIEDKIIEIEANKREIKITPEMASQEVERKLSEYGNKEELKNNMERLYGWTLKDFEYNIVRPDLYKENLSENVHQNEESFKQAQDKILEAQNNLRGGTDFESVVGKYSEGESVKNRGDLGWFTADQILPEISRVVLALNKGETSDIIKSPIGYHIVRLEDKKSENDVEKVKLKQIFVRGKNFGDWLCEAGKNYRVYILLKDYKWNKNNCQVEFQKQDLVQFEYNLERNSSGDVSVMF